MKNLFTITMLISFAMICSCQKQGSAGERQLAQQKAELDAREKALDEREKALAERENTTARASTLPSDVQSRHNVTDPEQVKAKRDAKRQAKEQRRLEEKGRLEETQESQKTSGAAESPQPEATSPTPQ